MYLELHTASGFSFLAGASQPEDLVAEAARLGYEALALCDRDSVSGAPRFHKAAQEAGVQALIGCEVSLEDRGRGAWAGTACRAPTGSTAYGTRITKHESRNTSPTLSLLVENRRGYQNLCRLLTRMNTRAPKGEGRATWGDIEEFSGGLIALLSDLRDAEPVRSIFGPGRLYVEVQRHLRREQEQANRIRVDFARHYGLPLLATNGVRYAKQSGRALFDVLTCVRHKTTLDQAGRLLDANAERHLKSPREMERLFADLPDAVRNTRELAGRLQFTLENLGYEFPRYPVPAGETPASYLRQMAFRGAAERYRQASHRDRAFRQIEHELRVIEKLRLEGYFLIVWDLIEFCRRHKILAQGRGSAANSAVCYSLGITAVDPVGMELLFERFLSEERGEWPDIDIDLPSGDQREKVIQHVYDRYGARGAGMTANVITYRGKSAVREVGKTLGFPEEMIGRLAKCFHSFQYTDDSDKLVHQARGTGFDLSHPRVRHLIRLCLEIQNLPRHLGQHSGGMVICQGELDSVVPLENARMPGRVVIQWDKDDCADLGIIKVDLLGLGMMAALEESIEILHSQGHDIDLARLPPDDPQTYAMIQRADTIGVFQIESRAQMATLPRLRPQCFYDLVVEVAIIRPGPIVGNMVHPYINRRVGREPVTYPHPSLEPILKRTLGVPLFQEQLLRLAMEGAGFTGGEAEELRRAMGFKRSAERMKSIEEKLRRGLAHNHIHGEAAEQIIRSITSFALYGFPESHAASFALIAYASAYLKAHYPAVFTTALLNCQPMGFYSPATLVKDAQRHGVRVRPIDVNVSGVKCRVEPSRDRQGAVKVATGTPACRTQTSPSGTNDTVHDSRLTAHENTIRLGLMFVSGLRTEVAATIERERRQRKFTSIDDLVRRVKLKKPELDVLAEIGALNSLGQGMHRREALWQIEKAWRSKGPLFEDGKPSRDRKGAVRSRDKEAAGTACRAPTASHPTVHETRPPDPCPLPPMSPFERLDADYRGAGLTTGPHPMYYLREGLNALDVLSAVELPKRRHGQWVRVAGAVIVRQRPGTAKGFLFISLEDETGVANIICKPPFFQDNRLVLTTEPFLWFEGVVQQQDNVTSVKAKMVRPLAEAAKLEITSHDFH